MHWKAIEKIALFVVAFVAVTALAFSLGSIAANLWFASESKPAPFVFPEQTIRSSAVVTPSENLFGIPAISSLPLQETSLRLTLVGVMPSQNPASGVAVIRSLSNKEELFQVGTSPAPNVLLKAVYDDHVVLERAGQLETLFFNQSVTTSSPSLLLKRDAARTRVDEVQLKTQPSAALETMNTFQAAFKATPETALQVMGVEQEGDSFRLAQRSPLTQFGLQAGDRIISVNGHGLAALQADPQLQSEVQQSGAIRAEIERGGKRLVINFSLK